MQGNLPAKALTFAHWSDARVAQEFTWKSATVTPNPGRAKLAFELWTQQWRTRNGTFRPAEPGWWQAGYILGFCRRRLMQGELRGQATESVRYGQQRRESDVLMAGQSYVTLLSRRLFLQASVGLVPSGWLLNSLAGEESSLPPDAEPVEAVRAFTPGPAKRYVFWTGQMRDFRMFRYWRDRYTCDDFAFVFSSPQHGEWLVISREPTPWYSWRLGPTYVEAVDGLLLGSRPQVRIVGLRQAIDRLPPVFPKLRLDPQRLISALIVEVWVEKTVRGDGFPGTSTTGSIRGEARRMMRG
jgi:hypothetical protein